MFCKNCGSEIAENAAFCGKCGTKVENTPVEETATVAEAPVTAVEEAATVAVENTAPAVEEAAPAVEEAAPVAEEAAPAAEEVATAEEATPAAEEVAPAAEEVAPAAEEIPSTDTRTFDAQPADAAPVVEKKKKKAAKIIIPIAAIIAVIAIVGVLSYFFCPFMSNLFARIFLNDEDYFARVNKNDIATVSSLIGDTYDDALNYIEKSQTEGNINIQLSDDAKQLIKPLIGNSSDEIAELIDCLKSLDINTKVDIDGNKYGITLGALLNGENILGANIAFEDGVLYAEIPTMSDSALKLDISKILESAQGEFYDDEFDFDDEFDYDEFDFDGDVYFGESGFDEDEYFSAPETAVVPNFNAIANGVKDLFKTLDGKTVEKLINKYAGIVFDGITNVEGEKDELTINGISQKCYKYTAKLNSSTVYRICKDALKAVKTDKDIEKILTSFAKTISSIDGEELDINEAYEEIDKALEELDKEDFEEIDELNIKYSCWIDNRGDIIARSVEVKGICVYFGTAKKGGKFGSIAGIGSKPFSTKNAMGYVSGNGKYKKGSYTGDFTVTVQGKDYFKFKFSDFYADEVKEGKLRGKMSVSLGDVFTLLEELGVDTDIGEYALLLRGYNISVDVNSTENDKAAMTVSLDNGKTELIRITSNSAITDKPSVEIPEKTTENIEEWVTSLKLDDTVSALEKAGVPEFVTEALKNLSIADLLGFGYSDDIALSDDFIDPITEWSEYDDLIAQIKAETDFELRTQLMHKAERILMSNGCIVPLYYYNDIFMQKDYVSGIYASLFQTKYFMYAKLNNGSNTLRINLASEPDYLDPALNFSVDGACLAANSFAGLYTYNAEGKTVPACADSYVVSEDGLTYTVTLKEGLKWSDGSALTASDFEYAWKRAASDKLGADYAYMFNGFAGFPNELDVTATDATTLKFVLTAPCAYMEDLMAFPTFFPVKKSAVESNPDSWCAEAGFVSNGAYVCKSWKHKTSMTYTKNPYFYDADNVTVEKLEFMLSDDDTAIYAAYNAGNLDFIDSVPADELQNLLYSPELNTIDALGTYYAAFNCKSPLFAGKTPEQAAYMRMAFSLLIDRDFLCENVGQTGQTPANSFIPIGMADGNGGIFKMDSYDNYYYNPYAINEDEEGTLELARTYLKAAGYKFGYDGKLSAETPITIEYLTNDGMGHVAAAQSIQNDLAAIGINMNIKQMEWSVFLDERKQGHYDIAREGWIADFNDPINMLEMWTSYSGNNDCRFGR